MKFSYHPLCVGKPTKAFDSSGKTTYWCNNKQINLGYGWSTVELEFDELFVLLTEAGHAIAPALTCDHRNERNFEECALVLVDIDYGMTIQELFNHPFYEMYGAGFYTTPSHTDSNHRFRIIHRLEQPLQNSDTLRLLYRSLMLVYGCADAACKDAARLFYGTENCTLKEQRSNTLSNDVVDSLVKYMVEQDALEIRTINTTSYPTLTDNRKHRIVELLKQSYVGQYEQWRNIGWGMRDGNFELEDFQNVTQGMMSEKTPANAKAVWNDYRVGEITMGTVIHFLKTRYGDDCLYIEEPIRFANNYVRKIIQNGGV